MNESEVLNNRDQSLQSSNLNILNDGRVKLKKLKKVKKIIITTIITIILIVSAGLSYFYFNSPKIIFVRNLNLLYKKAMNTIDQDFLINEVFNKEKVGLNSEIELNLENFSKILNLPIQKVNMKLNYVEDKKEEIGYMNLTAKINDGEEFEFESLMKDEKLYFTLKKYFDKYYYDYYKFISVLNSDRITPENIQYLLDIFKANLLKELSDLSLNGTKTKIKVNEKEITTKKTSLVVTEKILANILVNTFNQIKKDNKAQNILVSILESDQDEVIKDLDSALELLKEDTNSEEELFTYNIYTKLFGNKIKEEILLSDAKYEYIINSNSKEYIFTFENEESINIKFTKDKEITKVDGFIGDMKISGDYNLERFSFNLKNTKSESLVEINILGMNNDKEIIPSVKYENTFNFIITLKLDEENYKFAFTSKTEIEADKQIPNIYIKYSKKTDQLTEEELLDIYTKLGESEFFNSFFNSYNSEEGYNIPEVNIPFF